MCVIGSDKIKGEGRVRNETNYKDNSRHFRNLIKKKAIKPSCLIKERKEKTRKGTEGGKEEKREAGREGENEEGRERREGN